MLGEMENDVWGKHGTMENELETSTYTTTSKDLEFREKELWIETLLEKKRCRNMQRPLLTESKINSEE